MGRKRHTPEQIITALRAGCSGKPRTTQLPASHLFGVDFYCIVSAPAWQAA